MADLTISVPDAVVPKIRAAAVQRGFDADQDGAANAADLRAYILSLVRRDVSRLEGQRAGEQQALQAASEFGP